MDMLVVAEKSSVARAIRLAVKPQPKVLALRGHFMELNFPREYNYWRSVNPKELFKAPVDWTVKDGRVYSALTRAIRNCGMIVIATDNDSEGELIGYEVLLSAEKVLGKTPPYRRMRFNAATPQELGRAWTSLESSLRWSWVWKALFRHRFDLATGAAYTRLLTLSRKIKQNSELVSFGSCQTPTLWFVYQRELEIRSFKPEKYWVVSAVLDAKGVKVKASTGSIKDAEEAKRLYFAAEKAGYADVSEYQLEDDVARKPLPTDTDAMLQELSRIFGLSGAKAMQIAEALYADGYISYPRTETNLWVGVNHKQILDMLSKTPLGTLINVAEYGPRSGKHNDEAHPPIHPTAYYGGMDLKGKVWMYLARRYLANVVGRDAKLKKWMLHVALNGVPMEAANRYFVDKGFYEIFPYFEPKDMLQIPQLRVGDKLPVLKVELEEKETKPPPRITEAELLGLLKRHSIGTDATRAEYPHLIVRRGYAWKKGKAFHLSPIGERLIATLMNVEKRLVTPETRRYVEGLMDKVEHGEKPLEAALEESLSLYEKFYEALEQTLKKANSKAN